MQHGLDGVEHIFLSNKAHLEIELVELARRAIRAGGFIAETRRDLEVTVKPGNHEQLLELLGSLGQGVEFARVVTGRHQKVPRAFRAGGGENRGLELGKARLDHTAAEAGNDPCAEHDVLVNLLTAQIQEPIFQPQLIGIRLAARDLHGQDISRAFQYQIPHAQLNLTCRQLGILRTFGACHNLARDGNNRLDTCSLCPGKGLRPGREHALRQPVMVAQVYKQQPPMVALGVNPAGKSYGLANICGAQSGAVMSAVGVNLFHEAERNLAPLPVKRPAVYGTHMSENKIEFINSSEALAALCARLETEAFITVDTEFMREKTYYPELCLVQLAGTTDVAVVDAQAPGMDLAPLGQLLAKPEIVKVFHACRQDIEIFLLLFGAIPQNLFDTQVAAMVAGFGDQVGYDSLVQALTGAHIDKAHRFSDWSARPLSKSQLAYAAADVTHLRLVYEKLKTKLQTEGRLDWVAEEMAMLTRPETYHVEPERAWERLKIRSNSRRQLGVAKAIAAWREREAQRINIPRGRLLKDEQIPEIASLAPDNVEALAKARGVSTGFAGGRTGASLLAAIAEAKALPEESLPKIERQREASKASPALVALLKVLLAAIAEKNNVAPRLIAGGDDIEALALDESTPNPVLEGWRREMFGETALRLIRGQIALSAQGKRIKVVELEPKS